MSNSLKVGLLVAIVLIAMCVVAFFALSSNRTSGTVESEVKQMKPGARSKKPVPNQE
jgi:uncharacterized protein (UPF0333 family)